MRPSSRPLARWFAVGLTTAASAWVGSPAVAATPVLGNSSYTYQTPQGEQFYAVALRASDMSRAVQLANRHVILLDTSASQTGEYRERGLAALWSMLENLPKEAAVSVYALDVATEPLTDGFVPPADAAAQVAAVITNRAPLGATDLAKGLQQALAAFGEQPTGSVIYIGDGMSAANLLRENELGPLVETLRTRHIPVHAYAMGPDTDWRLLGVLAHQTGGLVKRDIADASPENLGSVLAQAAAQPVVYPETIGVSESSELILGESPPPLRSDRATILLGRGELPESILIGNDGTSRAVPIDAGHIVEDFPAVRTLALAAEQSDGLNMPAAGNELLAAVDGLVTQQVEQLATVGKLAAKNNQQAQAELALASLIQADPAAGEAQGLDAVINQADEEGQPVEPVVENVAAAPAASADPGLIEAEIQRQRVLTQQLTIETNAAIAQARELRQAAPGDAFNLLKRQESQIRASVEIDAEARRQLLRRLENEIVVTANMREKQESEFLLQQERLAELEAQRKVVARMMADEQELEQLISRVRALMYEGYHGDDAAFEQARIVAGHAVDLRPGNGPAMAALFTATAADQLAKAFRLRGLKADRFLETLYQVELSAVPFPDEPPIVYPAPEVWWALTERRKEYKSVSLDVPSAAELQIRSELDKPTRLEYAGIPLRTALQNLAEQHRINIVFMEDVIEEEGLTIDENIDLFLNGVTLRSALKLMLEPAGLSYAIEDEVLKITTETAAEEILSLRVYPVADLVIPIVQLGGGALGGGGGMGGRGGMMGGGMGGMGGGMGMGGMGGGMGMGGMGGGMGGMGMYSVPSAQQPGGPARNGRAVPQAKELAAPIDDAEMQQLLEGVVGEKTTALEANPGIAFASIRDDVAEQAGKKK